MKITNQLGQYFFEDKPLFGLDIGHDWLRVMQFDLKSKVPKLKGYGSTTFDSKAILNDVIIKPEVVAKSAISLFSKELIGVIDTKRVALSLPAKRSLTRAVLLPKMSIKDIDDAVKTEIEQYLPNHTEDLYMDYSVIKESQDNIEVFVVAIPKKIVDSALTLTNMLGLQPTLIDTAVGASARLFTLDKNSGIPSVIIDFSADTTDISVFNSGLIVSGSVGFGIDNLTVIIARTLRVSANEAIMLKDNYGLSKSVFQNQLIPAIKPLLEELIKEIKRTIRYYEQRYSQQEPIGQVVIMGDGASMPGLATYLTEQLRLPTRTFDPADHINFSQLSSFANVNHLSYVAAAGLAMTNPKEIFK